MGTAQISTAGCVNSRVAAKLCATDEEVIRLTIFVVVILFGLLVIAEDVTTDYDHSFNFSEIHTFATKIGNSWGNPLSEQQARDAVSKTLVQRGWQPADDTTADALVVIHGATQTNKSLNTFYRGGGYSGYAWSVWRDGTATTSESEYRFGTLVIDIFDAKDKKLVFRGVGQGEISEKPEKNEEKLKKGVEKMFKKFPPPQSGKGNKQE